MKKKLSLIILLCIGIGAPAQAGAEAADLGGGIRKEALFAEKETETDGENTKISEIAGRILEHATEQAQENPEMKDEAQKAEVQKRAMEIKKETDQIRRKAKAEAARQKEEKRMALRNKVVDFALQFEGNPYVYGGTSLTKGADCSGFVMSVFKEFGYSLPRVAGAQYEASRKKDISQIETGDLVFYGSGAISHVALYIGDGKIIHASTSASGIKISDYDYERPAGVGTYLK